MNMMMMRMMNAIILVIIYRKDQEKGNDCVMYVGGEIHWGFDKSRTTHNATHPTACFLFLFCTTQSLEYDSQEMIIEKNRLN